MMGFAIGLAVPVVATICARMPPTKEKVCLFDDNRGWIEQSDKITCKKPKNPYEPFKINELKWKTVYGKSETFYECVWCYECEVRR